MILGERKKKSLTTFTGANLSLSIPSGMMLHATFFLVASRSMGRIIMAKDNI